MRKIISGAVATLLLCGTVFSFAGCKKEVKREHETIQATDAWYSCTDIDIGSISNATQYNNFHFFEPVVIGDLIFVSYNAYDSFDTPALNPICVYNSEGELLREFEITEDIPLSRKLSMVSENAKPVLYYQSEGKLCKADFNESTYKLENMREIDIGGGSVQFIMGMSCNEYTFIVGEKQGSCVIYVVKGEEVVYHGDWHVEYGVISSVAPKENGVQICNYMQVYFFDPDKNEFKADGFLTHDYDATKKEVVGYDGRTYVKEADGVYVDGEPILKYCDTDGNIYRFMTSDLLAVTKNSVVFSSNITDYGYESPYIMMLYKQDSNPNAGKTVIKAASYGNNIDTMIGETIKRFNSEDQNYFIKYTSTSLDGMSDEELMEQYDKDFVETLTSSEAADIYFGIDQLWWYQTDDYFVDLSKELNLDPNTYYTNITDSISRDGKLYYMPVSFVAEGIWTDASYVDDGVKGFTYDEYKNFVQKAGNGTDILSEYLSRDEYFFLSFSTMNDIWFKDGKVDIANESFEKMCDYFINNVPEDPVFTEEDIMTGSYNDIANYHEGVEYSYDVISPSVFNSILGRYDNPVFLGIPTADGRGPSAYIGTSVSISAVSDLKDECVKFINTLISKDIQELNISNPINKTALPAVMDNAIEKFKIQYKITGITTKAEEEEYHYYMPDDKMKQTYIDNMEKVEVVSSSDPSIKAIVTEELSSVYSGQKDIKEVSSSLENRLRTMYSEKYSN